MPAAVYNIFIEQGATFTLDMVFKDANGVGIDQTGRTFTGQLRSKYNSSIVAGTFTITLANQITDPGKIIITMSAANTALIPVDPPTANCKDKDNRPLTIYQYDIEATNVDLTKDRVLQGIASVSPEVTR